MTELLKVSAEDYFGTFIKPAHIYNSRAFTHLNAGKCAGVSHYIIASDGKPRLGITFGERADGLHSPFSAPFGGFDRIHSPGIETFAAALDLLADHARQNATRIHVTLPPEIYDPCAAKAILPAVNSDAIAVKADYNYHFATEAIGHYRQTIDPSARNKLNAALRNGMDFHVIAADDTEGVRRAYEVIRINRAEHGYPLRMSLDDVLATIKIVPAEFYLLTAGGTDAAAAMVYFVNPSVAQVIYWGDIKECSRLRPMNLLAYELFSHLAGKVTTIDIGPSSSDGIPSAGLCAFKESVGCILTPKYSLTISG